MILLLAGLAFSIPPMPADEGLKAYADQAHLLTLFDFEEFRKLRTNPVEGEMAPGEALQVLLSGLPVRWEIVIGSGKTRDTITLTLDKEEMRRISKVASDAWSSMLIGEECQFGRIPAARAEALLGYSPGRCWCCVKYDGGPDDFVCASLVSQEACPVYDPKEP